MVDFFLAQALLPNRWSLTNVVTYRESQIKEEMSIIKENFDKLISERTTSWTWEGGHHLYRFRFGVTPVRDLIVGSSFKIQIYHIVMPFTCWKRLQPTWPNA